MLSKTNVLKTVEFKYCHFSHPKKISFHQISDCRNKELKFQFRIGRNYLFLVGKEKLFIFISLFNWKGE